MGIVPEDLLVEILKRVPVKSLCGFRCVSTHWLIYLEVGGHVNICNPALGSMRLSEFAEQRPVRSLVMHFSASALFSAIVSERKHKVLSTR
ncbi:hypothetical protein NL676_032166 [Syzygium grande]|nr:hypothetical protein NL676_032166 [Syzygium grande]